jgi:hypothetical protein
MNKQNKHKHSEERGEGRRRAKGRRRKQCNDIEGISPGAY